MAFASLKVEDLKVLARFREDKILGIGAIDVQVHRIEMREEVAQTIERVSKFLIQTGSG